MKNDKIIKEALKEMNNNINNYSKQNNLIFSGLIFLTSFVSLTLFLLEI
jgi:hypothetical protein